jgi:twitching motility protein PilT
MSIDDFLQSLSTEGVSDLHFKVGRPPIRRINGTMYVVESAPLSSANIEELAKHLLGAHLWEQFMDRMEVDLSYSIPGFARFRVNVFRQRNTISIIMRIIPFKVPNLDELGVPQVVRDLALSKRGLILVTGMSGSGKSSTLAGMVGHINTCWPCHIITIEDPIEFLHRDNVASIDQREVGMDTVDFTTALRSALRQDPDIILVGELRDSESMEIALRAAETGHLVLATLHTTDAKETIGRFIDSFPAEQQRQIRLQLSFNLRAVISQRLLERADKNGLVLAAEVMVVNAAIRGYIQDPEKLHEIPENIAKGKMQYGMQTFDQAIMDLYAQGLISVEEALVNATSSNDMRLKLRLQEAPAAATSTTSQLLRPPIKK